MAAGFKAIPTPKQGFVIQVRKGRVSALPALWKDSLGAQNCRRGINCYAARFLKTGAVKIELTSTVGGLKGQDRSYGGRSGLRGGRTISCVSLL